MKYGLTAVFMLVIHLSHGQSLLIKYVDVDIAFADLKRNGARSSYFEVVNPEKFLYLDCEYFDDMVTLYKDNQFPSLDKEEYCYRDEKAKKSFKFSAKSLKEIFDDDEKTKLFLTKMPEWKYGSGVKLSFPIYLYNDQAIAKIYGSGWSTTYRLTLINNRITFELCSGTIE